MKTESPKYKELKILHEGELEFSWGGPGTIPTVRMLWDGLQMTFECPISVMQAYETLKAQNRAIILKLKSC